MAEDSDFSDVRLSSTNWCWLVSREPFLWALILSILSLPRDDRGCNCSCLELVLIANAEVVFFSGKLEIEGSGNGGVEMLSICESLLVVDGVFRRDLLFLKGLKRLGRYRERMACT
jgi:hypothetical protein